MLFLEQFFLHSISDSKKPMMKNFELYILVFGILFSIQFTTARQSKEVIPIKNYVFYNQDEFNAIETDEISSIVKKVVETEYPGVGIAEAFIDTLGNYKLILVMDQDTKIVYLDTNGNWYSPELRG